MKPNTFHTRNFLLLLAGQAFSLLGNYSLKFALSMYALEQTGSAAWFAALLAVATVPTVLLSPVGGAVADRVNRRNSMVALDGISALLVGVTFCLLRPAGNLWLIALLQIALGGLAAFESPTVQACIPQMYHGDALLRANSIVNQIQALASMVTPFVGSLVYSALGIRSVLALTALCFFCTACLECGMVLPAPQQEKTQPFHQNLYKDLGQTMHFLRKEQPAVLQLVLLASLLNFLASGSITVGMPFLIRTRMGFSAAWYGAAESAMGVSAVVGNLLIGVWGNRLPMEKLHRLLMIAGVFFLPGAVAFVGIQPEIRQYIALVGGFCVGQVTCSMFSVASLCAIQQRTPTQLTGKVMAVVMGLAICAQPLGQVLYGAIFDWMTPAPILLMTGIFFLTAAVASRSVFVRLSAKRQE